jgi:hypothetical protein
LAVRLAGTGVRIVIEKAGVVAILDEARQGRYDKLHALLSVFVTHSHPDKAEIVTESLFTIATKLKSGEPSVLLAPQLSGIVKNHRLRVFTRERKQTDTVTAGGDEQLERYGRRESSDPAEILEAFELVDEEIAALAKIKEKEPRQFALLMARHQGIPDSDYLKSLGEDLSPDGLRQLRARTKKTTIKAMQQIRKASES